MSWESALPESMEKYILMHSVRRHELGEFLYMSSSLRTSMHSVRRHELGAQRLGVVPLFHLMHSVRRHELGVNCTT